MHPAFPSLPDNAAIGDTVAAVFRGRVYAETGMGPSLWQVLFGWVGHWFAILVDAVARRPGTGVVLRWGVIAAAVLLVARFVYVWYARHALHAVRRPRWHEASAGRNWWDFAQQLAAAGEYIDAAHALYLALLHAAARHGHVTLHESKTIGDYLREIHARGTTPAGTAFADFARTYETVVYGVGSCDAHQFHRLRDLAAPFAGVRR